MLTGRLHPKGYQLISLSSPKGCSTGNSSIILPSRSVQHVARMEGEVNRGNRGTEALLAGAWGTTTGRKKVGAGVGNCECPWAGGRAVCCGPAHPTATATPHSKNAPRLRFTLSATCEPVVNYRVGAYTVLPRDHAEGRCGSDGTELGFGLGMPPPHVSCQSVIIHMSYFHLSLF